MWRQFWPKGSDRGGDGGGGGAIFTLAPRPELVIEKKNRHEMSFKSNNCRLLKIVNSDLRHEAKSKVNSSCPNGDLPLITYAPRGRGGGQASYTFLLRITCKKGGGGRVCRKHVKMRT